MVANRQSNLGTVAPVVSSVGNASKETVDATRGKVEFGTLEKFYSFVSVFARSEMAEKLASIRGAVAADDWKTLHLSAHALKGSSGTACASDIHNTCKELQHSCSKKGELIEPTTADEVRRLVTRARAALLDTRA